MILSTLARDLIATGLVQRISEAAFLVDDPKPRLETLTSIPGIGPATATVVLAFHDPTNYAVGDRYMIAAPSVRTEHYSFLTTRDSSLNSVNGTQVGSLSRLSRRRITSSIGIRTMSAGGEEYIG